MFFSASCSCLDAFKYITFLGNLIVVVVAAFLLGLSIAFALGARQLVANLLSARELGRYQPGDEIRIGEFQGRIQQDKNEASL